MAPLRIAIRRFGSFQAAIRQQFAAFRAATGADVELEAVALDLDPLYAAMFTEEGLKRGAWDIGFLVTDWLPTAIAGGHLLDRKRPMLLAITHKWPLRWPLRA
jgi:multiple sugar transport system substrate-binding protein